MDTLHIYIKFIPLSKSIDLLKPIGEFLSPCRFVLHGLGLAMGALLLILCALFVQVGVRELIGPNRLQTGLVSSAIAPKTYTLYNPPTGPQLAPWTEAHVQNQRLLARIIVDRRPRLFTQ